MEGLASNQSPRDHDGETHLEVSGIRQAGIPTALSSNSGGSEDGDEKNRFKVFVTTLSMGLRTFQVHVTSETTVWELKQAISKQGEGNPPPDRQRLIYNKQELEDPDETLCNLDPPACEGSKFSMAVELKIIPPDEEEWELTIVHYHGYTEVVVCKPEDTVLDISNTLQEREGGEKWGPGQGRIFFEETELSLDEPDALSTLSRLKTVGSLQFYPMPNVNQDLAMATADVDLDLEDNTRRVLDVSPLSSPSSQRWFEVRLYEGDGGFQSVTVCISQTKTVAKLKLAIEAAFLRDHDRPINKDNMRLLCQAQVHEDSELVSAYSVGDRGTRDAPSIMQLCLGRREQGIGTMEIEADDLSDIDAADSRRVRSFAGNNFIRKNCLKLNRTPRVLVVVFVLTLGMILLGSGVVILLTPQPSNGTCSPSPPSWSSQCTNESSSNFRPIAKMMHFTEGSGASKCVTCSYFNVEETNVLISLAQEKCSARDSELPYVSYYIPSGLCDSLQNTTSIENYHIDAVYKNNQWVTHSRGDPITITDKMTSSPFPTIIPEDSTLVISKIGCKLNLRSRVTKTGYLCMKDQREEDFLTGGWCETVPNGKKSIEMNTKADFSTQEKCETYCKDWCYTKALSSQSELCCSMKYDGTTPCSCSAANNTVLETSIVAKARAKMMKPPSSDTIVRSGVTFFLTKGIEIRSTPDIRPSQMGHTAESCLDSCVETKGCRTALFHEGSCELWGDVLSQYPLSDGHRTAYTVLTPYQEICSLTLPVVWSTSEDCQQKLWASLHKPQDCYYETSSTCFSGHQLTFPTAFALALTFTGSALLLCFFICCSWERLTQLNDER